MAACAKSNWKSIKMKQLAVVLTTIILLCSTPSLAEEITMICSFGEETRTLKYVNPVFGFKKVLMRREGRWLDWDQKLDDSEHVPSKLDISDLGAIMKSVYVLEASEPMPQYILQVGDPYLMHTRIVLDFEFLERTVYWYYTFMSGERLHTKKEGHDWDVPFVDKWRCKKP
jgi:hypothetical protein